MRSTLSFLGLTLITVSSCDKNKNTIQSGLYTEESPESGRSQLNFIRGNFVVLIEPQGGSDTFSYSLIDGNIELIPTWTNQTGQQFEFKVINKNSFQIENLHPHPPEDPKTYMIYKK